MMRRRKVAVCNVCGDIVIPGIGNPRGCAEEMDAYCGRAFTESPEFEPCHWNDAPIHLCNVCISEIKCLDDPYEPGPIETPVMIPEPEAND